MANGHITAAGDRHGMPDIAGGGHVIHAPILDLREGDRNRVQFNEKVT